MNTKTKTKPTQSKPKVKSALNQVHVMLGSDLWKLLLLECVLREHAVELAHQSVHLHRLTDHLSQVRQNVQRGNLG